MRRSLFGLAQAAVCGVAIGLTLFLCGRVCSPGVVQAARRLPLANRAPNQRPANAAS